MKLQISAIVFSLVFFLLHRVAIAQVAMPVFGKQPFISGYSKALHGESMQYASLYPQYVKEALLTRCTDGQKSIEWETDAVPADVNGYAWFTWITSYSTGTSGGVRNFDLYINDEPAFTFQTKPHSYDPYWTFTSPDSTQMVFEYKKQDAAGDAQGMTYLRVPANRYKKGMPLRLKIVGQNQQSNDWYMVFKYSFKEKLDIMPFPFLKKGANGPEQPIQITALHFGGPEKLIVNINGKQEKSFNIDNGFSMVEVTVPAVRTNTTIAVQAAIGKLLQVNQPVELKPVTYREIDLVHHAHTDIGYSHIQEDVIKIHTDNIRKALVLIEKTKNYPNDSRFVWNIESAWAVENFLQEATPVESATFFKAVKEGQIVISATYANILTGLCTPEEMDWITEYARQLRDSLHLPINTAMMSDVPGMSWSMVPALAKNGVRYFSNGPNYVESLPDKGDRIGYTLAEQGNKAFWWKSAEGKDSILFWTCAKGYSSWHGQPQGAVFERGPQKIAAFLNELDALHYPYEMAQWRYNVVADNGPTDSSIASFVKQWNEKYTSPRLVLANVSDMFQRFEKKYGKTIPVISGDFTPYWEDGAYSTAKEEADTRLISEKLLLLQNVAKQKHIALNKDWLYQAKKNIVMFHEHTWGAHCSISAPDSPFTTHQWEYKKRFADSALYYTGKIEEQLTQLSTAPSQVQVVNTLGWNRRGYVEMDGPAAWDGKLLVDSKGNKTVIQKTSNNRLCFITGDVPANGELVYRITDDVDKAGDFFKLMLNYRIDSSTGAIKNLNAANRKWVNNNAFKGLLQALYVKGLNPERFSLTTVKNMEWVDDGPVIKKLRITCNMEGANDVVYEVTQFNGLPYIKLSVIIDKKAVREKESVHVAFPFAIPGADVRIGADKSWYGPGEHQVPGANKDFYSVQRWIDVSDKTKGVTLVSPQGALFELGTMVNEERINNGYKKWKTSQPSSPDIFLYAMNNYWHTNYKADQEGKVRFDCYLKFHDVFTLDKVNQFGYEITQPLYPMK